MTRREWIVAAMGAVVGSVVTYGGMSGNNLSLRPIAPYEPEDEDELVYITDTGKKYHRHDCKSLYYSRHTILLLYAQEQGYTPCSRCGGR